MRGVTTTIKPGHTLVGVLGSIAEMLISTERVHNEEGWRHRSALYWVSGQLDVTPMTLGALGTHPADELADFANTVATASLAPHVLRPPLALYLVHEAWGPRDPAPTLETVDNTRPTRPARFRAWAPVRVGMAVVGEHRLGVLRHRGGEAVFSHVRRPASPPPPAPNPGAGVPTFDVLADLYVAARAALAVPS